MTKSKLASRCCETQCHRQEERDSPPTYWGGGLSKLDVTLRSLLHGVTSSREVVVEEATGHTGKQRQFHLDYTFFIALINIILHKTVNVIMQMSHCLLNKGFNLICISFLAGRCVFILVYLPSPFAGLYLYSQFHSFFLSSPFNFVFH